MRSVPGGDRLFTANPVSRRRRGERARTAWPYGAAVRRGAPGAGGSGAAYRIRATNGARGRPGKAARCPFGRPLSGSPVGIHVKFRPGAGFSGTKVHRWRRANRPVAPRPAPAPHTPPARDVALEPPAAEADRRQSHPGARPASARGVPETPLGAEGRRMRIDAPSAGAAGSRVVPAPCIRSRGRHDTQMP